MAHLYASFADATQAEKATGALLDYGVRQEDLSLVANDSDRRKDGYATGTNRVDREYETTTRAGEYGMTGSAVNNQAVGSTSGVPGTGFESTRGVRVYDNPSRSDLDPMDADDDTVRVTGDMNPYDQGGPDSAARNSDLSAKQGISTTTAEDAGEGAIKGTEIGLGVGILVSLAALAVPGFGIVLGGGALASALGATALTAGAGAVAGGVTGYLKEQGVPISDADRYHGTIEGGGAILSFNIPSGNVDQATAEQILSKYGAADVNVY